MTLPRLICSGWWADKEKTRRVHDHIIVLRDGDKRRSPSHGICAACKETFIANLPTKEDVTHETR